MVKDMDIQGSSNSTHYVTRVVHNPAEVPAQAWDALLAAQPEGAQSGPFMRHAYLNALHASHSACPDTGWAPCWITLWQGESLVAACPLYEKTHSYGEYVFDWAWARAYEEHGLSYYPKGLVAVPFTPVEGPRLMARDPESREALIKHMLELAKQRQWSSVHVLFAQELGQTQDRPQAELMPRQTVQFHWRNQDPVTGKAWHDFDGFLSSLSQEKRKKIRQERRKVRDAGVRFEALRGSAMAPEHWAFFYRCYAQTYFEHGNPPYLQPAFFERMQHELADYWLLLLALNAEGEPIGCSLVALSDTSAQPSRAYGRYWGSVQHVDCLHFEACYYQAIEWCIAQGVQVFEGGAQGEHKMARALLPVTTTSGHWLSHPAFHDAVDRYLSREAQGIEGYLQHLETRNPLKQAS